jgi:SAM-dependent methyltransferase
MKAAPAQPLKEDAGSFRDRDGQVYLAGDQVLRGLSAGALANFRALRETRFFQSFTDAGEIIGTQEVEAPDPAPPDASWAGWLRHERIPFISYPYEWTFGMLRAAALLQLRLLEAALPEGWTLKDGSPYNVQFHGGRPVFIDLPSFEPAGNAPWAGYRQFCQLYLYPLMLQAYKGVDFQPFLRSRIDGIDVRQMARLFGGIDRLKGGVLTHVWLQALLERRYGGSRRDLRAELDSAGFSRELVLANVRRLSKLVRRLRWKAGGSQWADYTRQHSYAETDLDAKRGFVEAVARRTGANVVWDLGCNTGTFAALAARHCPLVLAMDADHLAVERLFQDSETMASRRILPLVQNLADSSPNWGWNLAERKSLTARGRPDLVLCLALVHHLVIGANVPLRQFFEWLAGLGGDLVIEFVGREDDRVAALLRNRVDQYGDYHQAGFEECLGRHYRILATLSLSGGRRTLYHCRLNETVA